MHFASLSTLLLPLLFLAPSTIAQYSTITIATVTLGADPLDGSGHTVTQESNVGPGAGGRTLSTTSAHSGKQNGEGYTVSSKSVKNGPGAGGHSTHQETVATGHLDGLGHTVTQETSVGGGAVGLVLVTKTVTPPGYNPTAKATMGAAPFQTARVGAIAGGLAVGMMGIL